MGRNQKKFITFSVIATIISLVITFSYHRYKEKELEKRAELFTESLFGKEIKKEKNMFVKLKESLLGTEEEKIQKKLQKKIKESIEIESKYSKEEDNSGKDKLSQEYKKLSEEIAALQAEYYSLTGTYYEEFNEQNKSLEKALERKLSPDEQFKEDLRNVYLNQNYSLANTSLFQKTKNFFSSNKVENFESDNQRAKIIYASDKIMVQEFRENELIREIEYRTEDGYNIVTVKIDDKQQGFIRNLDDIKSGFGVDKLKDGAKIEFRHENQVPTGPAVKYYTNGDREEFIYRNGKKHGFSTYYFSNGDKEEVYYIENVLEGKAKYTYSDGYVEIYRYKNGKREE